jgi:hypothetical protein
MAAYDQREAGPARNVGATGRQAHHSRKALPVWCTGPGLDPVTVSRRQGFDSHAFRIEVYHRTPLTTRMKSPEKNTTGKPRAVPDDVKKKQDPAYSPADFELDLEKATKRLDDPSAPGRGSARREKRRTSGDST